MYKRGSYVVLGRHVEYDKPHLRCLTCGCRFSESSCVNWDKNPDENHKGCWIDKTDDKKNRHVCPHCFTVHSEERPGDEAAVEQDQFRTWMTSVSVYPEENARTYLQKLADRGLLYVIRSRNRFCGIHLLVVITPEGVQNTIRTYLRGQEFNDQFFEKAPAGKDRILIRVMAASSISEIIPAGISLGDVVVDNDGHVDIPLRIRLDCISDIIRK